MKAVLLFLFCLFAAQSQAAEVRIETSKTDSNLTYVYLTGEIKEHDEDKIVVPTRRAVFILESPGGSVRTGLIMGRYIHDHGYATLVLAQKICASTCGFIWIAGSTRMLQSTAHVGFHAAFRTINKRREVSAYGNALVGKYFGSLNISDTAIFYLTEASPDGMQYLDTRMARVLDIPVVEIPLIDSHKADALAKTR